MRVFARQTMGNVSQVPYSVCPSFKLPAVCLPLYFAYSSPLWLSLVLCSLVALCHSVRINSRGIYFWRGGLKLIVMCTGDGRKCVWWSRVIAPLPTSLPLPSSHWLFRNYNHGVLRIFSTVADVTRHSIETLPIVNWILGMMSQSGTERQHTHGMFRY